MAHSVEGGFIKVDIDILIDQMETEEKTTILKSLSTSQDVIKWVLDFICNEDEDGWYDGNSENTRQDFLEKVEQTQLGQTLSFYWSPWQELRDKLKTIEANRAVYEKVSSMMRCDHSYSKWFRDNFDKDEMSHYTTKGADEKIAEIEKLIITTLESMKKND